MIDSITAQYGNDPIIDWILRVSSGLQEDDRTKEETLLPKELLNTKNYIHSNPSALMPERMEVNNNGVKYTIGTSNKRSINKYLCFGRIAQNKKEVLMSTMTREKSLTECYSVMQSKQ